MQANELKWHPHMRRNAEHIATAAAAEARSCENSLEILVGEIPSLFI